MLCLRVARLALVLVCLLSVACAARPPLVCPERGGPTWSEVTSEHLVLTTDAPRDAARRMIAEMERLHEALATLLPRPHRAPSVKLDVVVFERREDFTALFGDERPCAGFFAQKLDADFEPAPVMAFYDDPRMGLGAVFLHELTHGFLRERFASLPPWLDEGLAQYFATLRIEGAELVVGDRRSVAYPDFVEPSFGERMAYESGHGVRSPRPLARVDAPSLKALLSAGSRTFEGRPRDAPYYAAAWRLTHLLATRMPDRFAGFLEDLERGANAHDAFLDAFGDDMRSLGAAYRAYLGEPSVASRRVPWRAPTAGALERQRVLREAEVHLLWARLRPFAPRAEPATDGDLAEALRAEPGSAEARYLAARRDAELGREDDAARELDEALAARPEDPRLLYARLVVRPAGAPRDDRTRSLVDRLARVARSAAELRLVADAYGLGEERHHLALVFADRALEADPMCWQCETVKSRILFRGGRYAEAVVAADRALALAPEGAPASGLRSEREFLARVRDLERSPRDGTPGLLR